MSEEINPDVDNEFEEAEQYEGDVPSETATDYDEETGYSSMVGTVSGRPWESHTHSSFPARSSGGMVTSPPFAPSPGYPTTTPPVYGPGIGTTTTTTGLYPSTPAVKRKRKIVRLPSRFTEKVLLAFIDEENDDEKTNVVWAANLKPEQYEMVKDPDGEVRLHITFSLEDVYGNNDE